MYSSIPTYSGNLTPGFGKNVSSRTTNAREKEVNRAAKNLVWTPANPVPSFVYGVTSNDFEGSLRLGAEGGCVCDRVSVWDRSEVTWRDVWFYGPGRKSMTGPRGGSRPLDQTRPDARP